MREVVLHVGLPGTHPGRVQEALAQARGRMARGGAVFPLAPGRRNHVRLWLASTSPGAPDALRAARGLADPAAQEALRLKLAEELARECAEAGRVVLSCPELAWLVDPEERERLAALVRPLGRVTVLAHVAPVGAMLARVTEDQARQGRLAPLGAEVALAGHARDRWWDAAWAALPPRDAGAGLFPELEGPAPWLDVAGLRRAWEETFGKGSVRLRPFDMGRWQNAMPDVLGEDFGLGHVPARAPDWAPPAPASARSVARWIEVNGALAKWCAAKGAPPPQPRTRAAILDDAAVDGPPLDPAAFGAVAEAAGGGTGPSGAPGARAFEAPETGLGFRASARLLAARARLEADARAQGGTGDEATRIELTPGGARLLPALARRELPGLLAGRFAPHDDLAPRGEGDVPPPYPAAARGGDGRPFVIVGCMKNEAPYVVEWVAHHRAAGFDGFLIYTNGCTDGTDAILDRLQAMGVVEHRSNDDWRGNSPQQYALNRAMREPAIRDAEWIAHLDVDEFVNVRGGDGTIQWFLGQCPEETTNVAMTWRLFGHGGVRRLSGRPVIEEFEWAAPKYLPKPHTAWGFKTMTRNLGLYGKLSCHRPNKPVAPGRAVWVNGAGKRMPERYAERGWRSDLQSIGYDLLQLNHYALRSAESFLVKRQRGRALHVDRSIGLNYWVRMDWSDVRDRTIQASLPRMKAGMAELLADPDLARLHAAGLDWHREKAEELKGIPEFRELWDRALEIDVAPAERVAWALALDMES
ncbi:glycosyl transferase family 2 [Hasllibacter halocynthiae]|uniref:Glycosyl transferase family 2 n=1 Tax=Hasllibacter halocynthiae TaxID=595589 RepID=A0A2T0X8R2_9RHOB|nr:glycosyltransferase family 2 protein [Hasllibacter halocynthiae]PRY95307.1 glycosyl transferase family 2 [Hasllibacter halocynthiae]